MRPNMPAAAVPSRCLTAVKYAIGTPPPVFSKPSAQPIYPATAATAWCSTSAGYNYRLIARYAFGQHQVHLFVCWLGTHAEYDKLCARNQQYTVTLY